MKTRLVILLVALAALLSGCVRLHLTLDLAADDTASGTIVMAISDDVARTLGYDDPADAWADFGDSALSEIPGNLSTQPYSERGYTGVVVTMPATPIERLELGGANVEVAREGDTYVVSGGISQEDLAAYETQNTDGLDIVYTLSFPGAVIEHNGTLLDSNTVQWTLTDGQAFDMAAVGSAVPSEPKPVAGAVDLREPTPAGFGGLLWLWVAALIVAVGVATAVIVVARRQRARVRKETGS